MKFYLDPAQGSWSRMILHQPESACGSIRLRAAAPYAVYVPRHPFTDTSVMAAVAVSGAGSSFVHVTI